MLGMRHLKVLCCTVVKSHNFSRTAQKLDDTSPKVSEQFAAVQIDMGAPLCVRTGGSVQITPDGLEIYQLAKQIPATMLQWQQIGQRIQDGQSISLRVGTSSLVGSYFSPPLLMQLCPRYPHIAVTHEVDSPIPTISSPGPTKQVLATSSVEGSKQIVLNRGAVTFLPLSTCTEELQCGVLQLLSLPNIFLTLQLALILPSRNLDGPSATWAQEVMAYSRQRFPARLLR